MTVKVTYLAHSGFAVETENHVMIFDYYRDVPKDGGLKDGIIRPEEFSHKKMVVFSSHHHGDHFNRVILDWKNQFSDLCYVLSSDIEEGEITDKISAGEKKDYGSFLVEALPSTDEGVAFLVEVDGFTIYHAGDLNNWQWQGETKKWKKDQQKRYAETIEKLSGKRLDIAFAPLDPRLESHALDGILLLLEKAEVHHLFPMHLWSRYSFMSKIQEDSRMEPYLSALVTYEKRGEQWEIKKA